MFETSNPDNFEPVLNGVNRCITEEMNDSLLLEFTAAEVHTAIFQMAPLKAPGPDGLPPLFYHQYWNTIGEEVINAVLTSLHTGRIEGDINHTHLTLIPKVKSPQKLSEFRPISLCNVIYKIISKVITNRLKKILPHIISETQSAFVPGRLITDNVLVAFETLHHMKTQPGRVSTMALKLDMSKAYDRVEWIFLEKMMQKMGFNNKWIDLVMECVCTVSYSVLVNGEPHGLIKPSRGLRQGDPLSPYLFLICAEGLHARAAQAGDIHGVSLCRRGPKITHLFFADDSLLFCKATSEECNKIQNILSSYERASGQQLNRAKTTLFFSSNTSRERQEELKNLLGVPAIRQYEKYLGLPSFVGRSKKVCFAHIKERVWQKLQGWKEKLLSQAGKEILIKAVVQAVPTYSMGCFKLPQSLCKDIEAMIQKFYWG